MPALGQNSHLLEEASATGSDVVRGAAVAMSEDSRHAYPSAPVLTREPSLTMHSPSTDLPALFVRPAISCTVDGSL